mmetsp:Transcript_820/g.3170  ORF Transcript_820/g.3170 Transcript_820/m.3170 type:complete len:207 (-) Transcript_820:446-1066(-)
MPASTKHIPKKFSHPNTSPNMSIEHATVTTSFAVPMTITVTALVSFSSSNSAIDMQNAMSAPNSVMPPSTNRSLGSSSHGDPGTVSHQSSWKHENTKTTPHITGIIVLSIAGGLCIPWLRLRPVPSSPFLACSTRCESTHRSPLHAAAAMTRKKPNALNCVSPCTVSTSPSMSVSAAAVSLKLTGSSRSQKANASRKRIELVLASV